MSERSKHGIPIVTPTVLLSREPVLNSLETPKFIKKHCERGQITWGSKHRLGGAERPLFLRRERGVLYARLRNGESKRKIIEEAKVRDKVAQQFLTQGEVVVDLPGLGQQKAHYAVIKPVESIDSAESKKKKPPIFFIPGISNDLECVGGLVNELAVQEREVAVVAFPESYMGKVTPEFAAKVHDLSSYEPHTSFFKEAIRGLLPNGEEFDLWGYSTGCPIGAEILTDPEFQERVREAVFIAPASSVNQPSTKINQLLVQANEAFPALIQKRKGNVARWVYSAGRKDGKLSEEQAELREDVWKSLIEKVTIPIPSWTEARVKEKGRILIVSGGRDKITKSSQARDLFKQNPQVRWLEIPYMYHLTPILSSQRILTPVLMVAG